MKRKQKMEITPLGLQDFVSQAMEKYAGIPLPEGMVTNRHAVCSPSDYAEDGGGGCVDDEQQAWEGLDMVPASELTRPSPMRYHCLQLGTVLVLDHDSKPCVRVSDVARISGYSPEELHDFITPEHFVKPDLLAAGDASPEFVDWTGASLFCIQTPKGRFLIAWMEQVILGDLFERPRPVSASGFSGEFLCALTSEGLGFPVWKKNFLRRFPEAAPVGRFSSFADFDIPLAVAKKFALENFRFNGLIAYVMVRETEEPCGDGSGGMGDSMAVIQRLQPDRQGRMDARVLHVFLKVEQPYDVWIREMIADHGLVAGIDYFTAPPLNAAANSIGAERVTIEVAGNIGMSTPTTRGRLIKEYFQNANPSPSAEPGSSVAKDKPSTR